jgi:adenylosuccinate synthase
VKILGKDASDFPYELQNYSKSKYVYRAYQCWDDNEDWITEFDGDDWAS